MFDRTISTRWTETRPTRLQPRVYGPAKPPKLRSATRRAGRALSAGYFPSLPVAGFPAWAVLTVVVAGAEEAFLRGALFDAVQRRAGANAAVVVAAAAFAALHVPLYGWHVVPLDLTVGLVLGATRLVAGTWTAPAVAHVGADLVGWWLL